MKVSVGVRTDVGRLREANEDAYLVQEPLFVIADGMGGHVAGDIASSTAIEAISQHLDEISPADPQTLAQLVRYANSAVWSKAQSDASLSGMGTTCTLIYVDDDRAHVAHVGDSRAYRLRDGELEQLTEDHTLVGRLVREGRLPAEEAERHPQRNVITRVLGIDADVSVDLTAIELTDGDRLLLCSDGLTSMMRESDIAQTLTEEEDAQSAADHLVDEANRAGGEDNITVVVVDAVEDGAGSGSVATHQSARRATDPQGQSDERGRRRSWPGRLLIGVGVLVVLVGGAFALASYALANSWFVGVDEKDHITIFSGIPDEIAGISLRREEEVTTTSLDELPRFLRGNVQDGIKVDSLEAAHNTVNNLNDRAREFADDNSDRTKKS
jgi:PPM family protein phosphatase